jgi:hypothetical protein
MRKPLSIRIGKDPFKSQQDCIPEIPLTLKGKKPTESQGDEPHGTLVHGCHGIFFNIEEQTGIQTENRNVAGNWNSGCI